MHSKIGRIALLSMVIYTLCGCSSQVQSSGEIEVLAHRGACFLAPENTWAAAEQALLHGADWIEIDVRQSLDGVLFNFHDETLQRTTDGEGLLSQTHSSQIAQLDAGAWFDEQYRGTRVPTVQGMLDSLKGRSKAFFDVKRGVEIEGLLDIVAKSGFESDSFFWFADSMALLQAIEVLPDINVKVNARSVEAIQKWQEVCTPSVIECPAEYITEEMKSYCAQNNILIMAAIKEPTEESYRQALSKTPDIVNLDAPELWQRVVMN
ncbi:MAG: glycerophosphodiester phosphodiesterase family protein [Rikenellaceae bacterium]